VEQTTDKHRLDKGVGELEQLCGEWRCNGFLCTKNRLDEEREEEVLRGKIDAGATTSGGRVGRPKGKKLGVDDGCAEELSKKARPEGLVLNYSWHYSWKKRGSPGDLRRTFEKRERDSPRKNANHYKLTNEEPKKKGNSLSAWYWGERTAQVRAIGGGRGSVKSHNSKWVETLSTHRKMRKTTRRGHEDSNKPISSKIYHDEEEKKKMEVPLGVPKRNCGDMRRKDQQKRVRVSFDLGEARTLEKSRSQRPGKTRKEGEG